ncbi:MAG: formylglycine-generating enzyme family protein [Chloroflexi bacterium]|nr:formylglycine-generating enzyme family protein [Chloroflexota bacterium]
MGKRNQHSRRTQEMEKRNQSPQKSLGDDKPNFLLIAAIITTTGVIIAAIISYFGSINQVLLPIEATQTAEALRTSVAAVTQSAAVSNTSSPSVVQGGSMPVASQTPMPTSSPNLIETLIDEKKVEMVKVPEGYFIMGSTLTDMLLECNKLNYKNCTEVRYGDSVPSQQIYLMDYYIDKFEVTNENYLSCVNEDVCQEPTDTKLSNDDYFGNPEFNNYPVIHVTWDMAKTYCDWRGARLPTEAEWEKAARGVNGQTYPWGNSFDCKKGNFDDETRFDEFVVYGGKSCDGYDMTAPVGTFKDGVSPFGAYDMAGNVWEWVSSLYKPYPYDAKDGREDASVQGIHVIRGGSWLWYDYLPATYHRVWIDPASTYNIIGFRCVRDVGQ